jgi:uncharacterized membrane protein YgaE (UPF0421/DUF939 family)
MNKRGIEQLHFTLGYTLALAIIITAFRFLTHGAVTTDAWIILAVLIVAYIFTERTHEEV